MFDLFVWITTLLFWAWIVLLIMRLIAKKNNPEKYQWRRKWSNIAIIACGVLFVLSIPVGAMSGQLDDSSKSSSSSSSSADSSSKAESKKESAKESSKAESSSYLKKAESNNAKNKKEIFLTGVYNLPNSTKGVVSKAKYEDNMVTITVSDDSLNSASDDELKNFCFNMYRTINGEAKKDGLTLASITINDEQGDTLAETKMFGGFKYYGMGN